MIHADSPFTTRLFYKEALTLKRSGYEVNIVAPYKKDHIIVEGINIYGIKERKFKWDRLTPLINLFRVAKELRSKIYCCHGPEALLVGIIIKAKLKSKIVFSVRELYPESYEFSSPFLLKPFVKAFVYLLEYFLCKKVDFVMTVCDYLTTKFCNWKLKAITVRNLPSLEIVKEWNSSIGERNFNNKNVAYLGNVHPVKGIYKMIEAIKIVRYFEPDVKLFIIGPPDNKKIKIQ